MIRPSVLLAASSAADLDYLRTGGGPIAKSTGAFYDFVMILGAVLIVTLFLVFWAKYWRKSRRHRHRHHHHHPRAPQSTGPESDVAASQSIEGAEQDVPEESSEDEPGRHRHHQRRVPRREHRQRNPTLAETGGLPPIRDLQAPPPPI